MVCRELLVVLDNCRSTMVFVGIMHCQARPIQCSRHSLRRNNLIASEAKRTLSGSRCTPDLSRLTQHGLVPTA
jgi:hypothetical protein